MIKLIINPQNAPVVKIFDQKVVMIGSGSSIEKVDLELDSARLQPIHIKIIDEGQRYVVINVANDPFATLNDLPFGKKTLKDGDVLQIDSIQIRFELAAFLTTNSTAEQTIKNISLENVLDQLIDQPKPIIPKTPQQPIIESESVFQSSIKDPTENLLTQKVEEQAFYKQKQWAEEQLGGLDLEALIDETHQLEELNKEENKSSKENQAESFSFLQFVTQNFEDEKIETPILTNSHIPIDEIELPAEPAPYKKYPEYQVGEFDDESEYWTEKEPKGKFQNNDTKQQFVVNWKFFGTIAITVIFVLSLITGALYFNVTSRNDDEESRAAEAVADIAMALKYSQIHHIKPQKKNWSDPEFIKNSLANLIPHDYPSLVNIDGQGHLNKTSYSLRIYTSTDFSQFLVIAQPAPSVLQSLIPKTAIVVDSKIMQLRRVVDMKTLNRLLVNSSNLDNSNAVEVTNLVKKGELIPLNKLAKKRKGQDFSPPKTLALIRPGAEDFIYNAPRYYQMGEAIMKRAIDLMEMPGSAFELSRLKQEMSVLSKLQNMVLYSSEGINLTLQAQKAIAAFSSHNQFLTATLRFNPEGTIAGSQLIIDDESSHIPTFEVSKNIKSIVEQSSKSLSSTIAMAEENLPSGLDENSHPLLIDFVNLKLEREKALTRVKNQISNLIEKDVKQPEETCEKRLNDLLAEYRQIDSNQKKKIGEAIVHLSEVYSSLPTDDFISYVEKAGFGHSKDILQLVAGPEDNELIADKILNEIKKSENFIKLDEASKKASNWLKIKNFPDLKHLQKTQKFFKSKVLDRVHELLLSSEPVALSFEYNSDQLNALQRVLKFCGLECLEEQQYYLNEFDHFQPKINEL